MTTEMYLSQIRKLDKMINNRLAEIDDLRSLAENVSSRQIVSDLVQSSGKQDKLEKIIVKIIDAENEVDALVDRYVDKRKEIMDRIESMEYRHYDILYMRFIDGYTFSVIAEEMAASERQVYRWFEKAIAEFEHKYGKRY